MAEELVLSYVPGEEAQRGFYRGLGFEPTGEVLEGEVVMSLQLSDRSGRTAGKGPFQLPRTLLLRLSEKGVLARGPLP